MHQRLKHAKVRRRGDVKIFNRKMDNMTTETRAWTANSWENEDYCENFCHVVSAKKSFSLCLHVHSLACQSVHYSAVCSVVFGFKYRLLQFFTLFLCMLGNFSCFCCRLQTFLKINLFKKLFQKCFRLLQFFAFTLCMLGNFSSFCCLLLTFRNIIFEKILSRTLSADCQTASNRTKIDMSWSDVNYLQRLTSADNNMKSACPNQFQHTSKHFITQFLNFTFHKAQGQSLTE